MIDYFDRIYSCIENRNRLLSRLRFYSLLRLIVRVSGNLIIPVYFLLTAKNKKGTEAVKNDEEIIVSLTSFPARINRLWIVVESLLRQTHKPTRIILWLSAQQFPSLDSLPAKLLKQQARGLEIRIEDEDIRSHKKYYYVVREYPSTFLVTADDDIIYPGFLLRKLVELHRAHPDNICCHRAKWMGRDEGRELASYNKWSEIKYSAGPSFNIFQTSGGGTLFPPGMLDSEVTNAGVFLQYCKHADDVWLNCMSLLKGTRTVKSDYYSACFPVLYSNNVSLSQMNVENNENDRQINDVRSYYIKNKQVDLFEKVQ